MANIVIKELDLTTPSVTSISNEVVYVPGFATNDEEAFADYSNRVPQFTPTLCSTVAEFNYYFGNYPAVFTVDSNGTTFAEDALPQGNLFRAGTVDPSYVYAKELINAGITVLYEKMNDDDSDQYDASAMYLALSGESTIDNVQYDPYNNIANLGDYSVKYITSGGYPTFETGGSSISAVGTLKDGTTTLDTPAIEIGDAFCSTYTNEPGSYTAIYNDASELERTVTLGSDSITGISLNNNTFLGGVATYLSNSNAEQLFTFTATVNVVEEQRTVVWTLSGDGIETPIENLSTSNLENTYGISGITEGSLSTNDKINISVVTTGEQGWYLEAYNDTSSPRTFIGNITLRNGEYVIGYEITGGGFINSGIKFLVESMPTPSSNWNITILLSSNITTNLAGKLLHAAATRGDAVALIDHTNSRNRVLTGEHSVYYSVSNPFSKFVINIDNEYGAMFTPWFVYAPILSYASSNRKYNNVTSWVPSAMPGSFAYLMSLALSVRDNPSWLAIAGVTRGVVPNLVDLSISRKLTNAIAELYQPDNAIAVNPITNIRPYGYTIWGNRTLKNNAKKNGLTATSFLNIRNMLSDIKKQAYNAALTGLFEQNSEILWLNFKSQIEPLLDQMTSGYGITDYSITREQSNSPAKVVATIRIYPVYAVEMFEITVELSNSTLEVTE